MIYRRNLVLLATRCTFCISVWLFEWMFVSQKFWVLWKKMQIKLSALLMQMDSGIHLSGHDVFVMYHNWLQGHFQASIFVHYRFFWGRLSFSRKGINFLFAIWHEYLWMHSWIYQWNIFVAKTLKLINYDNTVPRGFITDYVVISWNSAALTILFERRCLWH